MARQHVVGIRLDIETKAALQAIAEQQNRTLSNMVATICQEYYKRIAPFHDHKKAATSPS